MSYKKAVTILFVLSLIIISGVFLTSCELINQILGNNSSGGASKEDGIIVTGDVNIAQGITTRGQVVIGFVTDDPNNTPPVIWADFSNSSLNIGYYDGNGNGQSFPFNFDNVPEGKYWMLAFIDENSNMNFDLDGSGNPTELNYGFYPFDSNNGPYLMDFNSDMTHLSVDVNNYGQTQQ